MPKPLRVVFMGTPDFAVPSLAALHEAGVDPVLVVTQPDRPRGRGQHLHPTPVKLAAEELGIPVATPAKLDGAFIDALAQHAPDAVALVAYGKILPPALLMLAPLGCINVHPSLLPRWRGAAPIQRAIMAGDTTTGVTIIEMSDELDAGDILLQQVVPIASDDDAGRVHDRLAALGGALLVDAVFGRAAGTLTPVPQEHLKATYAAKIERDEREVDWATPARRLHDHIRALSPVPGAYTWWRGQRLGLFATTLDATLSGRPGEVLSIGESVAVACTDGALRVQTLQPEGGKALQAADFCNGYPIAVGQQFGDAPDTQP